MKVRTSRAGTWTNGPRTSGFTLFELLVVVVLLALSVGLVAPAVGLVDSRGKLETAAALMRGAVNETRSRSMLSRQWAELRISNAGLDMSLLSGDDGTGGAGEHIGKADLPEGVSVVRIETEGMDEEHPPDRLVFHPRGLTLPCVVQFTDDAEDITVYVRPLADVIVENGLKNLETMKSLDLDS